MSLLGYRDTIVNDDINGEIWSIYEHLDTIIDFLKDLDYDDSIGTVEVIRTEIDNLFRDIQGSLYSEEPD